MLLKNKLQHSIDNLKNNEIIYCYEEECADTNSWFEH